MESFNDVLTKVPIVIDNGTGVMKAGFANEKAPGAVFPTYVGRPKYRAVIPKDTHAEFYLGNIKDEERGLLKLHYPIQHGVIKNREDMDLIWRHCYTELKAEYSEHPVLLTEPPLNPHKNRYDMAQQFFENYGVQALFVAIQGVLSVFASGKSTGVVFESGEGVTQVVPVVDGYTLSHANQRIDLGGRQVTENLVYQLRRAGVSLNTTAEFDIARQIKESKCYMIIQMNLIEEKSDKNLLKDQYKLPDGSTIELGMEKIKPPEILFNPSRIGLEYLPFPDLLVNAIQKCDVDLRKKLYEEIILSGGNTQINDFPTKFISEVKKIVPKDNKLKIFVPPERNLLCWTGGAIISKLSYFKNMWITKKEYEDEGYRILLKKTF